MEEDKHREKNIRKPISKMTHKTSGTKEPNEEEIDRERRRQ